MKTSRTCAALVATLALFVGDYAHAGPASTAGETVVLQTFSKVWVNGDAMGPLQNGAPRLGQKTGAGTMDAHFAFDATNPASVILASAFTYSTNTPNNNNSYEQGAVALASLTASGVKDLGMTKLPVFQGDRPFMRPTLESTAKFWVVQGADDGSNGVNNNPMPLACLIDKATAALVPVKNATTPEAKGCTNLIQQALKDGIKVQNPNNQRGIHSMIKVGPNSFVGGMQYNNNASEIIGWTVNDDATIKVNFLTRVSNDGQHCRPQVALLNATTIVFASIEANTQPSDIGARVALIDLAGKVLKTTIPVKSDRRANKSVAEPMIVVLAGGSLPGVAAAEPRIALGYQMSQTVTRDRNNGHAGGAQISNLAMLNTTTLELEGPALQNAAPYGRHSNIFATTYGPNAEPAVAYIGGSSTGTKGAFEQLIPLSATGALGLKDSAKLYPVSAYSDVANVQARGKRNPQDQARGFINGLGSIPNPGYGQTATGFMPEVKAFSFSTITGYTDAAAAAIGKRNSIWLSLVPAAWAPGIQTTPGGVTDKPGSNPDGTGPSPRSSVPGTNPSGDATSGDGSNVLGGTDATGPDANRPSLGSDNGGCSATGSATGSSSSGAGFLFLAIAGAIIVLRRKNGEV